MKNLQIIVKVDADATTCTFGPCINIVTGKIVNPEEIIAIRID